jgi:hypothetical protein
VFEQKNSPAKLAVLVVPGAFLIVAAACAFTTSVVACREAGSDVGPPDVGSSDANNDVSRVLPEAGVPFLKSLSVTSAAGVSGIVLTPGFSPDTSDYYVRCAAGANPLTVKAEAEKGATVAIDLSATTLGQPLSDQSNGYAPSQNLSPLSVSTGQAIVAIAKSGSATSQYWVRCLPNDMAVWTWSPHPENGALPSTYFMLGDLYPPQAGYALVLDQNGVPVWFEPALAGYGISDVDSTHPSFVSFMNFIGGGIGAYMNFNLSSWTVATLPTSSVVNSDAVNNHELKYYPKSGNYLMIGERSTPGVDLTGVEIGTPSGKVMGTANSTIQDCELLEIDPSTGAIVDGHTWLASQHFITKAVTTTPYGTSLIDVYHCNSIDVDPANGNLLISMRNANTVFYMTWPEGDILWKMGGFNQSNDDAPFVTVPSPFAGQHDARLHNWNQSCNGGVGQVSLYDDETDGTMSHSRAVIYDVVVGTGDSKCGDAGAPGTATVAWEYPGSVPADFSGSVRPLPGSKDPLWVIGWGQGSNPFAFSVIDQKTNKDLLDFAYQDPTDCSYRAIPALPSDFDLTVLRETAGLPIP